MNDQFNFAELNQFSGSETFYKRWHQQRLIYTEGVQYLEENAGCSWLIDQIALFILPRLLSAHIDHFYTIEFVVLPDRSAVIIAGDGNGNIHFQRELKLTIFPILEKPVKFYLCESEQYYCLMLPREY